MSLFKTLSNKVRTAMNKADKALKNPVEDGKLAIEDSKKQIGQFETKIADLMVHQKQTEKKISNARTEVTKYEKIAKLAGEMNNVDDVRSALEQKAKASKTVGSLRKEKESNQALIDAQRSNLEKAKQRIIDAENNLSQLESRMAGAKLREDMASADSDLMGGSGLSGIADLEKEVEYAEAKAESVEDLGTTEAEKLEDKYSSDTSSVSDDDISKYLNK